MLGLLLIVLDLTGLFTPPSGLPWGIGVVLVMLVSAIFLSIGPRHADSSPVEMTPPVTGRWLALNTPGQSLPSHGTRSLGQYSAVDMIMPKVSSLGSAKSGSAGSAEAFKRRPPWRGTQPQDFSCFGAPVLAMAGGTVVAVSDRQKDQRARDTWLTMLWFSTGEGLIRVLAGWRAIVGNRVVIDHGSGVFSAYAHIKQGSAQVAVGQEVQVGQEIAQVGNTGNTTEPHLHAQLMDRADFTSAAGLPMTWRGIDLGEIDPEWSKYAKEPSSTALAAMPRNGQIFTA